MGSLTDTEAYAEMIKEPNVAGVFYPADKDDLSRNIDEFLQQAGTMPQWERNSKIAGIISPHAGYIYSGPVAAYSYKIISRQDFDTAVILAPSHYFSFKGAAIMSNGSFMTPLGRLEINKKLAGELTEFGCFQENYSVFEQEHSIEVQLPFLLKVQHNITILPVLIGQVDFKDTLKIAEALIKTSEGRSMLLIVSTDLSHYHDYKTAKKIDSVTISCIKKLNPRYFWDCIQKEKAEACGYGPLAVFLNYLRLKKADIKILRYSNSGDTAGDKNRVVGYLSAVGYSGPNNVMPEKKNSFGNRGRFLSLEDKKCLLNIARNTLEKYLLTGKKPDFLNRAGLFSEKLGAFVTLKKNSELRGCIGRIIADRPLWKTVRDMAVEAAVNDPRFPKIKYSELPEIEIEISVLSPVKKVNSPDDILLGKHGVIVKQGFHQGVFLPQVAEETGWTKEEFLSYLCSHKAGLMPEAWKDKNTALYVFTADVFSEYSLTE